MEKRRGKARDNYREGRVRKAEQDEKGSGLQRRFRYFRRETESERAERAGLQFLTLKKARPAGSP